jgi:hypothetical protein
MDWFFDKAIELRSKGKTYPEISKALDIPLKTVQSRFKRHELRGNPIQHTENLQDSILKELSKECAISYLSNKYKIGDRMTQVVIEDIIEQGYLVDEYDGKVKLCKSIIPEVNIHEENWNGDQIIKFGVTSDNHMCNKWQQLTFLNHLYDMFERNGITTVYNGGDLSDGFYKNRPSHIYELMPGMAGADAQADYIINKYPNRKGITTKFITGNHDDTHIMNGGVNIGRIIAKERPDMIYLGMGNAKVNITPNCIVEINHPGDGAAYALSYSLQKLIDSMQGGEKPNILLNAHHHKAMYLPAYRNIHAFETGTTEAQTPFMKGKKIAANMGGWIIEAHVDKEGTITRCKGEFIALYKSIENDY